MARQIRPKYLCTFFSRIKWCWLCIPKFHLVLYFSYLGQDAILLGTMLFKEITLHTAETFTANNFINFICSGTEQTLWHTIWHNVKQTTHLVWPNDSTFWFLILSLLSVQKLVMSKFYFKNSSWHVDCTQYHSFHSFSPTIIHPSIHPPIHSFTLSLHLTCCDSYVQMKVTWCNIHQSAVFLQTDWPISTHETGWPWWPSHMQMTLRFDLTDLCVIFWSHLEASLFFLKTNKIVLKNLSNIFGKLKQNFYCLFSFIFNFRTNSGLNSMNKFLPVSLSHLILNLTT